MRIHQSGSTTTVDRLDEWAAGAPLNVRVDVPCNRKATGLYRIIFTQGGQTLVLKDLEWEQFSQLADLLQSRKPKAIRGSTR